MSGRGSERILDLIEWLAGQVTPSGLADVSQAMAVPKSSTLLLLRALVERGYVRRLADGRYELVRLPGDVDASGKAWGTLLRIARPFLERAVGEARETGFVAVLDAGKVRYLNKLLPDREIRYDRDISSLREPHQVASGIVLLAGLPASERETVLHDFSGDREALQRDIERVALDGYFFNAQGVVEGAAGVAAPVLGSGGFAVAAINISGPRDRIISNIDDIVKAVVDTAARLTEELQRRGQSYGKSGG